MNNGEKELTPRQLEVLTLIAQGYLNKQIAYERGIALQTVKNHVRGILTRLGVHNRAHAVSVAKGRGILPTTMGEVTPDGCDFNCGKTGEPMIALVNENSGDRWICHLSCLEEYIELQEELNEDLS